MGYQKHLSDECGYNEKQVQSAKNRTSKADSVSTNYAIKSKKQSAQDEAC